MDRRRGTSGSAIGMPMDRVDGRLKVTGSATYVADFPIPALTHAVLVQSPIARGRITRLDTVAAAAAPGVLGILSHLNAPHLPHLKSAVNEGGAAIQTVLPLGDDAIHHVGQPIAVVVASTWEQAQFAATLVRAEYEPGQVRSALETRLNEAYRPMPFFGGINADYARGDPAAALGAATIHIEQVYTTPIEHHNPMEPHAAIAVWHGDGELTVYDTTQGAAWARQGIAEALELAPDKVRVICPFVGGGFGTKGGTWPYAILAALAARQVGHPVKLVLTRAQMFTSVGYRSQTIQELQLGAQRDGSLTAICHSSTSIGSKVGENPEPSPEVTKILYACPNLETHLRLVQLDLGVPTSMRAPGEAPGTFALESAMDELAVDLDIDPIDLRLRNYAETDPASGMPWSSNGLRECYAQGAERFDWARRNPRPRSMRAGRWLVGWGMATASYPTHGFPAQATATIKADGRAVVRSATADLGTGQYTVMTQVAADALGLPPDHVTFELGDSDMPYAFVAGGSSGVRSVGPAVRAAGEAARAKLLSLATSDDERYAAILARHGLTEVTGEGSVDWVEEADGHKVNAFGAQFVEVRVDPDLGLVRVSRALGVFDIGQVLNPKTARSQAIGGMVWGIGMALLERTAIHPTLAAVVSPNLAGYLLPVHADVPAIDAFFVDVRDPYVNSLGAKGMGELGITGVAAAIANAVYHATGKRIRDLPISPEKLLCDRLRPGPRAPSAATG